ncbi:MAG: hypothetical protein U0271_01005 [Polyangiaceae bacterium]
MIPREPQLVAHLQRHARTLSGLARGFGRQRDADDILQTLYTRWWRRMQDEPSWVPPDSYTELFVCVRRVVIDVVAKERRDRLREDRCVLEAHPTSISQEDSLHAFERLQWILDRLPPTLSEALVASLGAGRRQDAEVARELGLTTAAYTARLFKARRAAEDLATFYELLPLELANLMAELSYGGKSRAELARDLGMLLDDVTARWKHAMELLEKHRGVVAS